MLSAKISKQSDKLVVTLKGHFDEQCSIALDDLAPKLRRRHVEFNLAGVDAINSLGFRAWVNFLRPLADESTFDFVNCPPSFLDYSGLLSTTSYASRIVSFQVPFRCRACQIEVTKVYEVDSLEDGDEFDPAICPKCNGVAAALVTVAETLRCLRPA